MLVIIYFTLAIVLVIELVVKLAFYSYLVIV